VALTKEEEAELASLRQEVGDLAAERDALVEANAALTASEAYMREQRDRYFSYEKALLSISKAADLKEAQAAVDVARADAAVAVDAAAEALPAEKV
jgi:hypothetical protein